MRVERSIATVNALAQIILTHLVCKNNIIFETYSYNTPSRVHIQYYYYYYCTKLWTLWIHLDPSSKSFITVPLIGVIIVPINISRTPPCIDPIGRLSVISDIGVRAWWHARTTPRVPYIIWRVVVFCARLDTETVSKHQSFRGDRRPSCWFRLRQCTGLRGHRVRPNCDRCQFGWRAYNQRHHQVRRRRMWTPERRLGVLILHTYNYYYYYYYTITVIELTDVFPVTYLHNISKSTATHVFNIFALAAVVLRKHHIDASWIEFF